MLPFLDAWKKAGDKGLEFYLLASRRRRLPPGEGVFLACSFWLVDAYIPQKRFADARATSHTLHQCRHASSQVTL